MPGLLESPAELAAELRRHVSVGEVIIASDALITHIGALEWEPGAVVAAGTGAVALGTDHVSIWNRSDGWGVLLGDEGSGAWIGAHGISAALHFADHRTTLSARLLRELERKFGTVADAVRAIHGSPSIAHTVAAFAPSVATAAHDGDPVAVQIWQEAGRRLAKSALAASRGLPPTFSWGGRLFDVGKLLTRSFREELLRGSPEAVLRPPRGDAASGALLLAADGLRADRVGSEEFVREFGPESILAVASG